MGAAAAPASSYGKELAPDWKSSARGGFATGKRVAMLMSNSGGLWTRIARAQVRLRVVGIPLTGDYAGDALRRDITAPRHSFVQ